MKKRSVFLLLLWCITCISVSVSASPFGKSREEKMIAYKVLYGEEEPVDGIKPALAPETETPSETAAMWSYWLQIGSSISEFTSTFV